MKRKATLNDFEALYDTYMDERNNPFMLWEIMHRESFLPIVREMVAAGELFVYEIDGRVAAAYRLTRKQHRLSHVAYLGSFAVHPQFKGKALGTRLMNDLIEDLRSQEVKRLELLVVTDNHKAVEFYERLGFEVEGILKGFLKRANSDEYVDEVAMALLLN
jgi:ribosomal protein S18 acetylase RimI-like enzyme